MKDLSEATHTNYLASLGIQLFPTWDPFPVRRGFLLTGASGSGWRETSSGEGRGFPVLASVRLHCRLLVSCSHVLTLVALTWQTIIHFPVFFCLLFRCSFEDSAASSVSSGYEVLPVWTIMAVCAVSLRSAPSQWKLKCVLKSWHAHPLLYSRIITPVYWSPKRLVRLWFQSVEMVKEFMSNYSFLASSSPVLLTGSGSGLKGSGQGSQGR